MDETGHARSINRQKFRRADLEAQLADPASIQGQVLRGYLHLLRQRAARPAFHPHAGQRVFLLHTALFALARTAPSSLTGAQEETVLCLVNVSSGHLDIQVDLRSWDLPQASAWQDLIQGDVYSTQDGRLALTLDGYQTLWLQPTE